MFAFYRCRTKECNVRISVHTSKDLITDVRGEHLHENKLLGSLVKAKVDEVKKQALYGAYSKPCAVYSSLVASIESDPATKMGLGKFYHYFPP